MVKKDIDVGCYVIVGMHDTQLQPDGTPILVPSVNSQGYPFLVAQVVSVAKHSSRRGTSRSRPRSPTVSNGTADDGEEHIEVTYFEPRFNNSTQMDSLASRLRTYGTSCTFTGCMRSSVVTTKNKNQPEKVVRESETIPLSSVSVVFGSLHGNSRRLPLAVQKEIAAANNILWHNKAPSKRVYEEACIKLYTQKLERLRDREILCATPSHSKRAPQRTPSPSSAAPSTTPILVSNPSSMEGDEDNSLGDTHPRVYSRQVLAEALNGKYVFTPASTYSDNGERWDDTLARVFNNRSDIFPNTMIRSRILKVEKSRAKKIFK
jgi:hypothetical protein